MDGNIGMTEYYETDNASGNPVYPKSSPRVLSSAGRGCPECRMPLRDIHRYNRIVKKAILDLSTKRFVANAHKTYLNLVKQVQKCENNLENEASQFAQQLSIEELKTGNAGIAQDKAIVDAYKNRETNMQRRIDVFIKSMKRKEQPFGRVNALLAAVAARLKEASHGSFQFDESSINTGFQIRGDCVHLQLTWAVFRTYGSIYNNPNVQVDIRSMLRDWVARRIPGLLTKCQSVRETSNSGNYLPQEVEAMIYYTLSSTLSLSIATKKPDTIDTAAASSLQRRVSDTLNACENLIVQHPGTLAYLRAFFEKAKMYCDEGVFYAPVTQEELRRVYIAMASQFQGTGHWYYCQNNHPFTVGDCGMPMEEARCPQCGERVEGDSHVPVPGVCRAPEFDEEVGPN